MKDSTDVYFKEKGPEAQKSLKEGSPSPSERTAILQGSLACQIIFTNACRVIEKLLPQFDRQQD